MYHRYMPTGNGQFQRQTLPDKPREERKPPPPKEHRPPSPPRKEGAACQELPPRLPHRDPEAFPPPKFQLPFLEKLLPNMDSGDLLLLLIMLLLLSEGNEESSSVVMTLAIFLFLQ